MYKRFLQQLFFTRHTLPRHYSHLAAQSTPHFLFPNLDIHNLNVKYNLPYSDIYQEENLRKEGTFTKSNVFSVDTGKFTGRSPNDKYIVKQQPSENNIWWGSVNKPISKSIFDRLLDKCTDYYNHNVDAYYVFDGYCGSNAKTQKKVRFLTEYAWQHHFVKNMFIEVPSQDSNMETFIPDMTIINACNVINENWKDDGMHSENFILFNIEEKIGIIGGTQYAGEMKKGIFSMMNYWLPEEGILSMHCSANINKFNETTLFFGLSGTGKTTLSTEKSTKLIGDDEHGWDDEGIFNFEGGCYAKTNGLCSKKEPLIYNAIKKNALLENIVLDKFGIPDYGNIDKTENGRVSYPLNHIPNAVQPVSKGNHPKNIIFLTCDRFGVLPSVAKLTKEQAMYYFLSGYTSKVSGTERGITFPQATFSPCFGGAFLTLPPEKYAQVLYEKIKLHDCNVFLVNTGWSGNGKRFPIDKTRKIIKDIMDGSILNQVYEVDPIFFFEYPIHENPKKSWKKPKQYRKKRAELAKMFQENFEENKYPKVIQHFGPIINRM